MHMHTDACPIHTYLYAPAHTCVRTQCTPMCTGTRVHTYTHITCSHTCTHMHAHVHAYTNALTCARAHAHNVHILVHTRACMHMHARTHNSQPPNAHPWGIQAIRAPLPCMPVQHGATSGLLCWHITEAPELGHPGSPFSPPAPDKPALPGLRKPRAPPRTGPGPGCTSVSWQDVISASHTPTSSCCCQAEKGPLTPLAIPPCFAASSAKYRLTGRLPRLATWSSPGLHLGILLHPQVRTRAGERPGLAWQADSVQEVVGGSAAWVHV